MTKVCIELENGKKMFVELYEDIAPLSVKNFLKLVDEKFYDGIIFHRIIKKFMCQAGGYYIKDNTINEKRAESIYGEFESNGFKNDLKHGTETSSSETFTILLFFNQPDNLNRKFC